MGHDVHMFNLETTERTTAEHVSSFQRNHSSLHVLCIQVR